MTARKILMTPAAIVGGFVSGLLVIWAFSQWRGAQRVGRWELREPRCAGRQFTSDPELGFVPRGRAAPGSASGPGILFLGSSFLWGECGPAADSLPARVAASLGGHVVGDVP